MEAEDRILKQIEIMKKVRELQSIIPFNKRDIELVEKGMDILLENISNLTRRGKADV